MKHILIKILGGFTKEDLDDKKENLLIEINKLSSENSLLRRRSNQLDKWFLASTDVFHNFNTNSSSQNMFDNQTSKRIREVAT